MKKLSLLLLSISFFVIGCNKEIDLNLPEYEPKLVLEFYLENNTSLRCLLQESTMYTDTSQLRLVNDATVIVSYNGIQQTLVKSMFIDPRFDKIYNYYNPHIIQLQPNTEYEVYVKDGKGRELRGKTRLNSLVPIDSLVYNFNASNKAAAGLLFKDDSRTKNYYRIVALKMPLSLNKIHCGTLHSMTICSMESNSVFILAMLTTAETPSHPGSII